MAPDRFALQNMEKKATENFKEYARRWRDVASQVQPPLTDKEMPVLFISTLKAPYYEKLIGNATKKFADLVMSGEIIENAVKSGKLEGEPKRGSTARRKEGEAQVVEGQPGMFTPYIPYPQYYPYYPTVNNMTQNPYPYRPMNSQLQVPPRTPTPMSVPTPAPKLVTQPNLSGNAQRPPREKPQFDPIPISYTELLPKLIEARLVVPVHLEPLKPPFPKWYDINTQCDYHAGLAGHSTENCTAFKRRVQGLIAAKVLNFEKMVEPNVNGNPLPDHSGATINALGKDEVHDVCGIGVFFGEVIEEEQVYVIVKELPPSNASNPVTILYKGKPEEVVQAYKPAVTILVPSSFPYKNSKAVPWKYGSIVIGSAANITGVGGMTRSGRCYNPEVLKAQNQKAGEANKQLILVQELERKEPVSEAEACEFLKFIKHSEYNVVEQLNKTPAKISLLSLLLNSEPHREALLKVLNESYVPHNVSVENVDQIVGNIAIGNFISFNDEEIPPEGRGSTKALHITASCKECTLVRVLIDNGSSLNVMPMSTLAKLPVDTSHMKESHVVVRAFNGTRRDVMGDIEIPLQVGPCTFLIQFQVMDITPTYSCLLGRPWIHMAGAVPSSLHQKVKFIVENHQVSVSGEEDLLVTL